MNITSATSANLASHVAIDSETTAASQHVATNMSPDSALQRQGIIIIGGHEPSGGFHPAVSGLATAGTPFASKFADPLVWTLHIGSATAGASSEPTKQPLGAGSALDTVALNPQPLPPKQALGAPQPDDGKTGVVSTDWRGTAQQAVQEVADEQAAQEYLNNIFSGAPQQQGSSEQQQFQALGDIITGQGQSTTGGPPGIGVPDPGSAERQQLQALGDMVTGRGQSTPGDSPAQALPDSNTAWFGLLTDTGSKAEDSGPHKPILHSR